MEIRWKAIKRHSSKFTTNWVEVFWTSNALLKIAGFICASKLLNHNDRADTDTIGFDQIIDSVFVLNMRKIAY